MARAEVEKLHSEGSYLVEVADELSTVCEGGALLKLEWVAERARRCERIKRELAEKSYGVPSEAVARRILALE